MTRDRRAILGGACLSLLCLLGRASSVEGGEKLVLAVVPQQVATVTARAWGPMADRLGVVLAHGIELRLYHSFDEFEAALAQGVPDLAFLNPYYQTIAHRSHGYLPLVRDGARRLTGVVVVRADSPVRTLADLRGRAVGFPDPNAFGASLYLRALLAEKERVAIRPVYLGSHANVYRHVLMGEVPAGGGIRQTLEQENEHARQALRVLYETPAAAPHPLSAHPRVPARERERIAHELLQLATSDTGRALLQGIGMPQPVRADQARDYAPLERLHLERYADHSARPRP